MSGLVLKLAPNERVLINGAVIENGDRRSRIAIRTPNANVLRLKDAIVDRYRPERGERPNVDTDAPDVPSNVSTLSSAAATTSRCSPSTPRASTRSRTSRSILILSSV